MPGQITQQLVNIALNEVGVHEVGGNNQGPRIREYQLATWLAPGAWPWCSAFTCWCLREWLKSPEVCTALNLTPSTSENWRCRDASAFGWEKWGRQRSLPILSNTARAKAGDIVIFDFSHVGFVTADQKNEKTIATCEGNTNGKGQRDSVTGDGVWTKVRSRDLVKCYVRIIP